MFRDDVDSRLENIHLDFIPLNSIVRGIALLSDNRAVFQRMGAGWRLKSLLGNASERFHAGFFVVVNFQQACSGVASE